MNLSRSQELKKQIWMNSRGADGWVTKYELVPLYLLLLFKLHYRYPIDTLSRERE